VKYGGLKFLEGAHVKDMLAVLRWADNPKNRMSAFRVLQLLPGMGPANAGRCFTHFEASGHDWRTLASFSPPPLSAEAWPAFAKLMEALGTDGPWEGQAGRVRDWYEPHLDRIYDATQVRAGDLQQLERIAVQFPTRERFLSELALDPPKASSDLAGTPSLDEDYLILSTIHSAKGQEWDAVHILNVADGNFPSEFATGKAEQVEEERRLLYVAMTRAKTELHVIAPLRYYVAQQLRRGDAHVYGARSRFMTRSVMAQFEQSTWPIGGSDCDSTARNTPRVDVAGILRGMW
jgi:ATP-dependent DNA helicase UvrD/PcrA